MTAIFKESDFIVRDSCNICGSQSNILLYTKYCVIIKKEARIVKCSDCGFVYSMDELKSDAATLFYNLKFKESNYASYSKFDAIKKKHFFDILSKINKKWDLKGGRLLDLGCGEGQSCEVAHSLGYSVTGVEISTIASEKARKKNIGNIYNMNLSELNSVDIGEYDVICLFDVLDHVSNPRLILELALSHLKPNGILIIEVCNINSFYRFIMRSRYSHIIPYEHLSYFSPGTLANLLNLLGMNVSEIRNVYRKVSYEFLNSTMSVFNPAIGKGMGLLARILPRKLRGIAVPIPVGIITIIARKNIDVL